MEDCPFKDFPLEITRIILEDVSRSCPKTAHALVLSGHTTRTWIEPILYFDVSIPNLGSVWAFKRSIEARNDPAFFARSVRTLTICVGDASATDSTMNVCTRLTTLRILIPVRRDKKPHIQRTFLIPDLRHLTSLASLIFMDGLTISVDRLPPHITHVRILCATRGTCSGTPRRQIMDMFRERPSVTHLMCGLASPYTYLGSNELPTLILNALQNNLCPHLRVFAIVGTSEYCSGSGSDPRCAEDRLWRFGIFSEIIIRQADPRVIVVNTDKVYFGRTKDVLDMDSSEEELWEKAEEYLNERRALQEMI